MKIAMLLFITLISTSAFSAEETASVPVKRKPATVTRLSELGADSYIAAEEGKPAVLRRIVDSELGVVCYRTMAGEYTGGVALQCFKAKDLGLTN